MIGTLVNTAAIVGGGALGLLLKKGMPERLEKAANQVLGLSVLVIGGSGLATTMIKTNGEGGLSSSGEMLLLTSLVIGVIIGELLGIDDRLNSFGHKIEKRLGSEGFAAGFINATLIYCVGAMAIIGSISDGLMGDSSILFVKSMLDGVCSIVLASTLGVGVLFSALAVLLYQGTITLLAQLVAPYATDAMMAGLCTVGYTLVLCIGINFMGFAKIKTANLLPSLLVPVVYQLIVDLV